MDNEYTLLDKLEQSPVRMWINQPSTQQTLNRFHGENVLTYPPVIYAKNGKFIQVFFTKGTIISMIASINSLSLGWKNN